MQLLVHTTETTQPTVTIILSANGSRYGKTTDGDAYEGLYGHILFLIDFSLNFPTN
jgi:hypothetical protein